MNVRELKILLDTLPEAAECLTSEAIDNDSLRPISAEDFMLCDQHWNQVFRQGDRYYRPHETPDKSKAVAIVAVRIM